jgi:hypothetical protein
MTGAEPRRGGPITVNAMDRFIDGIELAAAAFIGIVAVDIFVSVLLRYLFSASIPDSYDFGRLLLGILIFWGIAATSFAAATSRSTSSGPRRVRAGSAQSTSSRRWCCCLW